jgi:hypothetical protein
VAEVLGALGGAVIGGALVLLSDNLRRRAERRGRRDDDLRRAAAEVIATYGLTRTRLIAARVEGRRRPSIDELWTEDRTLPLALLFTLPGGEALSPAVTAVGDATNAMVDAFDADEDAWAIAALAQRDAVRDLEGAVRAAVTR